MRHLAGCHGSDDHDDLSLVSDKVLFIKREENVHRRKRDTFIPVREAVITREPKTIGGGKFKDRAFGIVGKEVFRARQGCFQRVLSGWSGKATVPGKEFAMIVDDFPALEPNDSQLLG